jgi:hypothetical protein
LSSAKEGGAESAWFSEGKSGAPPQVSSSLLRFPGRVRDRVRVKDKDNVRFRIRFRFRVRFRIRIRVRVRVRIRVRVRVRLCVGISLVSFLLLCALDFVLRYWQLSVA